MVAVILLNSSWNVSAIKSNERQLKCTGIKMEMIYIGDHFILNILPTFKHLSVQWKVWIHPVKNLFLDHAGSNCSKNQWCRKSIKGQMHFCSA